jgi:hypothetical protein
VYSSHRGLLRSISYRYDRVEDDAPTSRAFKAVREVRRL